MYNAVINTGNGLETKSYDSFLELIFEIEFLRYFLTDLIRLEKKK